MVRGLPHLYRVEVGLHDVLHGCLLQGQASGRDENLIPPGDPHADVAPGSGHQSSPVNLLGHLDQLLFEIPLRGIEIHFLPHIAGTCSSPANHYNRLGPGQAAAAPWECRAIMAYRF